ncbi:MAG: helix-turn-helix domain-containing protein [Clostridiales bacterium]|nr:helix-turn-helix domain-containing protein [Clostridiales bacterium]
MEETHYSIKETGRRVGVESHVLRYWEDELNLDIPRNGQGHRYYTEYHIRLFQKIRSLKEKGYQLKAIEGVLKKYAAAILKEGNVGDHQMENDTKLRLVPKTEETAVETAQETDKMNQFQQIMNHIIGQAVETALQENNETMSEEISRQVNDRMVRELEYMMRINEEREEERFKMLDETLRAYQRENQGKLEAAATRLPFFRKKRFARSGKKL